MSKSSIIIISAIVGLVAGAVLSSVFYCPRLRGDVVEVRRDTTIVVDTNIYINPLPVNVEISISEKITVPPTDITITEDSLIVLPKSVKTYSDKSYKCQVSGYQPNLDWIEVYPETQYITTETTRTTRPKPWGIGVQAGGGIYAAGGKIGFTPYIGVGVSYNFIRF